MPEKLPPFNTRRAEAQFRTALLNAWTASASRGGILSERVEAALRAERWEDALDIAARAGAIRISDQYAAVYTASGQHMAEGLSDVLDFTVDFDRVNDRAVSHMQQERLRLIREFAAEQRMATRAALEDGIRQGVNPRAQARRFRESIGLTRRQVQSTINFRRYLDQASLGDTTALHRELRDRRFDRTVQRAIRTGEPLSPEQINRMQTRYRERYLRYRSEVIARTESMRAVNTGQDEAIQQAIEDPEVPVGREDMRKTWIATRDDRVRDSHAALNGVTLKMDELFEGRFGMLRYPHDPGAPAAETIMCRCALAHTMA